MFYYADEFNVSWLPTLRAMWSPKGQQVMIPTPGQPKVHYGLGAVNYHTGETVVLIRKHKRRLEVAELLQTLVDKHPTGTIFVAWDNFTAHQDDEVEAVVRSAAGRLVLLYLPTYSPWLNPIEMLWRHFRREVTHCELFETVKALIEAAEDFFCRYNQTPEKVLSIIGAHLALLMYLYLELRQGGTWTELYPPFAIQNRFQVVAVLLWLALLLILGWLVYPILRITFPGLEDHGYPFVRLAGLLLLAYPTWLAGSLGIPATRMLIALVLGGLLVVSFFVAFTNRRSLLVEIRDRRSYFFYIDLLTVAAFLVFLFIRLGNPDLWHLYFGGEKPMDFSYLNAVLKSDIYPPYDPWFAGGLMNYYYYGFVIVGLPVKLLGITPSVAYNLILPTLFSFVVLGAFSIGWNLGATAIYSR